MAKTGEVQKIRDHLCGVAAALALLFLVLVSLFPVSGRDVFLYLEVGRRFFAGEGLPATDIFRFTGTGAPLELRHEFGAILAWYLAYAAGGFSALVLLKTALITATGVMPFWVARRLDPRQLPCAVPLLAVAAFYGASGRFVERGSLFSDLFSTLVLALVLMIRARAGSPRLHRALIPAVFLVWVNCHAGYVVGFLLLILWALADLAEFITSRPERRAEAGLEFRRTLATAAAAVTLGLVNPLGWRAYGHLTRLFMDGLLSVARKSNYEYMSPFANVFIREWDSRVCIATLLACTAVAALATAKRVGREGWRKVPLFELLSLAVLIGLGFGMARFIITASFGAVTVAAALLAQERRATARESGPDRARQLVFPALSVLIVAGCVAVAARGFVLPGGTLALELGVDLARTPEGACAFIDANGIGVNLLNQYEYGAYLVWRWQGRRKVFIHGFNADAGFLERDYLRLSRSWSDFDRIVATYRIGGILLEALPPGVSPSSLPPFRRRLLTDPQWREVYADGATALYLRDVPENRAVIARYAARPLR